MHGFVISDTDALAAQAERDLQRVEMLIARDYEDFLAEQAAAWDDEDCPECGWPRSLHDDGFCPEDPRCGRMVA